MATTTDWGILPTLVSQSYSNSFASPQSQFLDTYSFYVSDASFNSISSTISLGNVFGINNLQSMLYSGTIISSGQPGGTLLETSTATPIGGIGFTGSVAALNPITLSPGSYVLGITGQVVGTNGGTYSGFVNIVPTVPEPGEWGLLLCGLGLIGFIFNSHKRNFVAALA